MGQKLTTLVAVALFMFLLAPFARADEITTPTGYLVTPQGSQVTSVFIYPFFGVCNYAVGVDFQFQGGTGSTAGCALDIEATSINFTIPVTDLSLTAIIPPGTIYGQITVDGNPDPVFQCGPGFIPSNTCPGTVDLALGGSISGLGLSAFEDYTFSGIESMSFVADDGDPPSSALVLFGFGLIVLLTELQRKRSSGTSALRVDFRKTQLGQ